MTSVHLAIWMIRLSIGLVMISFGISQLVNPRGWLVYMPKWLQTLLPGKPETFMREHASGNVVIGLLFASGLWPMVGGIIAGVWWLTILPFAFRHDRYIAMRDSAIIVAIAAEVVLLHA